MAEGPLRKKQKVDDEIFQTFHDKYSADDMSILRAAYLNLFEKQSSLKTYSIKACNGHLAFSFKHAFIDLEEHIDEIYPIADIFQSGLSVLHSFLQSKKIPEDCNIRRILSALLTYLLDQDMMKPLDAVSEHCGSEQAVTLLLLNHLLLPLTPPTNCIVDSQSSWRFFCPDKCGYRLDIESSDTSIGNIKLWHGRIDAIIGKPLGGAASALSVVRDDGTGSPGFRSCIEMKKSFVDSDIPVLQIISQAIVFSFLQSNLHPELKISMIPTIGISTSELIVYFYDHKNDVLLQSIKGFDFKVAGKERIKAILVAWLVINYKYLCSGFVEALNTAPKANFFEACKDVLDLYKNNIRHGGVGRGQVDKPSAFKYDTSIVKLSSGLDEIKRFAPD